MMSVPQHSVAALSTTSAQVFYPRLTIRCVGAAVFRSQLARDIGCLLDVDDDVVSWHCAPDPLILDDDRHQPDFLIERYSSKSLIDAGMPPLPTDILSSAAKHTGLGYEVVDRASMPFVRLKNAKDLLRYAGYETPLSDRIRLLAALDEHGTLSVGECLSAFCEVKPVAGLASLILHRFVSIDLDHIIGPETQVRRCPA